ncbi:GGDEF domain-containing protein [uncultured Modestobacter sp.]|uniref:GGDEF domain-containing protein n=1 Tax=uncultured Modestobacter sp. TaxID=380048 RepID=UPI0026340249|nr:GGDEF domain-containing protein [uncultured Modestobacter sp.]
MGDRLPPRVVLLALLHGSGGLLCAVGALHPMSPRTPVGLLWALAAVGVSAAAGLLLAGARVTVVVQHLALALFSTLLAVLAGCSATAVGVVGLGPVLVVVGLYAAHFLSLRTARAHAGWLVAAATAGAWLAEPSGFAMAWLVAVVSTLLLTEAHGRLNGRLRTDAATDPLTGLANRRAWQEEAERCLARAQRVGEPLTVALLDLDDFKLVNDRDGHSAGDRLLRRVAAHWQARLRTSDLLGRYGGDEFVLCLPDTDAAGARDLLDRLDGAPISWSVGTATARPGDSLPLLLQRADAELYALKRRRGRAADPGARLGDG